MSDRLEEIIQDAVDKAVKLGQKSEEKIWQAKYDTLKASHKKLVEAIKEGRKHYKNNCPINMFIVWEEALKEAEKK